MRSIILLGLLALPAAALAQSLDLPSLLAATNPVPPLTLDITPQYPRPGGVVTVTPRSTVVNLEDGVVVLFVNGTEVYRGNAAPVSVTLAPSGTPTTIKATATIRGANYTATATVRPGDVSVVAEPLSFAPALYAGKPLVPEAGSVRLVAVADFRTSSTHTLSPAALSYVWRLDGTELESASGVGKNAVVVASPLLYRSETVSVSVESQDGSITGGDSLTLTPQSATLRLYVSDPLLGILFDHALSGDYRLAGPEVSLAAVPYSFSLTNGVPATRWFLNGATAQTGGSITLRPSGSGAGSADLLARAESADGQESASADVSITFGSSGAGIFGL